MFRFSAFERPWLLSAPVGQCGCVGALRLIAVLLASSIAPGLVAAEGTSSITPGHPPAITAHSDLLSSPAQDAIQRAAREGIGALSPIQLLPVVPDGSVPFTELPLDPTPCDMPPTEVLSDASLIEDPSAPMSDTYEASLPAECAKAFPDILPPPEQPHFFGLEASDAAANGPVVIVTRNSTSMHPWFSAVGSQQGFSYGEGRWMYREAAGPSVALGNLTSSAPVWGSTVPIGGLQLSSGWGGATEVLSEGTVAYSSVVGRLNHTNTAASAGAIDYGVTASSGSLRYGLTPALTLESQVQSAPDMSTRGLGTTYSAGQLGTFRAGVTRSEFDAVNAWRYRFGYNVNLTESVSLAVTNEQVDQGFGDLSVYRNGTTGTPVMRNTLAAGVPMSGGTLTGTFTGTRESGVAVEQRFGVEHSRLVAPDVRLAVGANRDVVSGDYEMRAGITMPVEAFMRGRWLSW